MSNYTQFKLFLTIYIGRYYLTSFNQTKIIVKQFKLRKCINLIKI